ncbi:uncharacterized protein FFFS_10631 [Fusarium fujikuroi]
MSLPY